MKKTILLASMLFAAVAVNAQETRVAATSSDQTAPAAENKNQAEIKFEQDEYNFGTIKQGDKVEYTFNYSNVGKEPLIISNAAGSCGCTVPVWTKEPIKKGEKGTIQVTFNSAGKQGMQDKTVTITSNAVTGTKVLHLKGNVEMPPAQPAATTPNKE